MQPSGSHPLPTAWRRAGPTDSLTPYELGFIAGAIGSGAASAAVSRQLGCSRRTVREAMRRVYRGVNEADSPPEPVAAPDPQAERVEGLLLALVNDNADVPATRLLPILHQRHPDLVATFPNVSALARRLRSLVEYKKVIGRPPLTDRQRLARIHFVATFDLARYDDVVWTDEVMLSRTGSRFRWMVAPELKYDGVRVAAAESYMAWGGVCVRHGSLPLVVWDKGVTVDAARYVRDVLEAVVGPWLDRLTPQERARILFMQDGARAHWGPPALAWFRGRDVEVLEWPAHSPDLNVIELVWAKMKAVVNISPPSVPIPDAMVMSWGIAARAESVVALKKACLEMNWASCVRDGGGNAHQTK